MLPMRRGQTESLAPSGGIGGPRRSRGCQRGGGTHTGRGVTTARRRRIIAASQGAQGSPRPPFLHEERRAVCCTTRSEITFHPPGGGAPGAVPRRSPMSEKVEVNEKAIKETMAELSAGFARNAGAVADVLARWRKPEVARAVIDSVLAGDGRAFRELARLDPDPVGPPIRNIPDFRDFCTILFEVAEKLSPRPQVTVCRLRIDPPLSGPERVLFSVM